MISTKAELSDEYRDYIDSPAWCLKRAEKIVAAGPNCQECGKVQKPYQAHVHHLHYKTLGNESLSDLQVLCRECHEFKHRPDDRLAVEMAADFMGLFLRFAEARYRAPHPMEKLVAQNFLLRNILVELAPEITIPGERLTLGEQRDQAHAVREQFGTLAASV